MTHPPDLQSAGKGLRGGSGRAHSAVGAFPDRTGSNKHYIDRLLLHGNPSRGNRFCISGSLVFSFCVGTHMISHFKGKPSIND